MFQKKTRAVALICVALLFLVGCSALQEAAAQPSPTAPVTQLDQSSQNLTEADLAALYSQTQLVSLDLRGNDLSPDAVAALMAALPNCAITWSVPLGTARFDSTSTSLVLPADVTAEELARLSLFPALTTVDATAVSDSATLKAMRRNFRRSPFNGTSTYWVRAILPTQPRWISRAPRSRMQARWLRRFSRSRSLRRSTSRVRRSRLRRCRR